VTPTGSAHPEPRPRELVWEEVVESEPRPPVDAELDGWEIHRHRPGRTNARREFEGRRFQLKWFTHSERATRGGPARTEFANARTLAGLGVPGVIAVGWGRHATGSFLVMRESPGAPIYSLPSPPTAEQYRAVTTALANYVARMHDAGYCHRDLYLDHVLIDGLDMHLIDVGRLLAFRRRRWVIKDLSALLFSAWREGVPAQYSRLFLRTYLAATRRRWRVRKLLGTLARKAQRYREHNRHEDLSQRPGPTAR